MDEPRLELGEVEVAVDIALARPAEAQRIDDAVVVELVADDGGVGGHQLRQQSHHRRIGGAVNHRRLAPMKRGEALFERAMRRPGAADEAHGARPGAEALDRALFRGANLTLERQAEIGIGVHAQEGLVALALDENARSAAGRGRQDAAYNGLLALAAALLLEFCQFGEQDSFDPIVRHGATPRRRFESMYRSELRSELLQ